MPTPKQDQAIAEAVAKSVHSYASRPNADEEDAAYLRKLNQQRQLTGFQALDRSSDLEEDGNPVCSACGKDGGGTLQCAQCRAVFYCNRDCQKHHWKVGGHKHECATLKEEVKRVGKDVVARMKNDHLPGLYRVQGLKELDGTGYYRVAVREGLNDAMRDRFQEDSQSSLQRYRSSEIDDHYSTTSMIMTSIFRGQRREGSQQTGSSFRCIDPHRICLYIASHDHAFRIWFDSSLAFLRTALDDQVYRTNELAQQHARQGARDIWACWIMVFTKSKAAKAILVGSSSSDTSEEERNENSIQTVKYIASSIKDFLEYRWDISLPDKKDPGGTLEGTVNQVAAMVSHWTREFEIPVDFDELLNLPAKHHHIYKKAAVPLGKATIAKGSNLTAEEGRQAMMSQGVPEPHVKKERKKGKKGRRK